MKWLLKILGVQTSETDNGIMLGNKAKWKISGVTDPNIFFNNLRILFSEHGNIMFFEGVVMADDVMDYITNNSIENDTKAIVAPGTIWPKSDNFHVLLTERVINGLLVISKSHASCEICDHFHVYKDCVFRSIPATDSGGKPATHSGRSRPPIPVEVGRLIR